MCKNGYLYSSALAALGTLQRRALRLLKPVDSLVLVSNYYIDTRALRAHMIHA